MYFSRSFLAVLVSAASIAPQSRATTTTHKGTSSSHQSVYTSKSHATAHPAALHKSTGKSLSKSRRKTTRVRGQQEIDAERATQIQQALIREHYLDGDASGNWDTASITAMQKYQSDHGWQTKLMPDSRALKALGLGPDYSNAINAKDGNFAAPPPVSSIPPSQAEGFTEASGVR